ncbi:Ni/Fe hydrogenase subunit alpha [Candidatus Dojkabacteria bacterium]|nr:Ni/Fe hydrogenase subunit alpha [Candidatus Dojkabacteria bacterium]
MTKKITIDPVTRVEGHGKVTIHLDENNKIKESRFHIVEFRGFERFVKGRPYWEIPVLVQRLCGICPVSHHLAAAKAMDMIVGANSLTPTADKMRRLMHYGQILQSHALHFFYLASPDLLFGYEANVEKRNVVAVAMENKELALQGINMRKFGQEIIKITAGKKIHGTGAIPGGINKNLTTEERDFFLKGEENMNVEQIIKWARGALDFFKNYHSKHKKFIDDFAYFPSNHLSLVTEDGAFDPYHGVLRAVDSEGNIIFDKVDSTDYYKYMGEQVKNWSYMKFPFILSIGKETGWYRVGPLARINTCDFMPSPLAQKELEEFRSYNDSKPSNSSMHMHWARLIEILHCAEMVQKLLNDKDLEGTDLVKKGNKQEEGIGLLEAPRGTLFHHYKVNENDLISMANLIVATTNNNEPMNKAVNYAAKELMNKQKEITEEMMNGVEVAIRAYDPCLSCATHALGQMPLKISLYDSNNKLINQKIT